MTGRGGGLSLIAACVAAVLLAACAGTKDLRYRQSVDSPPLTIPAGLDAPRYSEEMEIPAAGRSLLPVQDLDLEIEKPPSLSGN